MTTPPQGTIKASPGDFVVGELPAYLPSGEGSHLYVHFKKTNVTTDDAVRGFARALGIDRREIGVAGLKDKVGVTTQWISLPAKDASLEARVAGLGAPGVEILEHRRHGNKLKTGHLKGNRFTIVVRDIDRARLDDVTTALLRIGTEGVPNAFGAQRFGRANDTHEQARAWLTGQQRAPGDPRLRRFHFSALQSAIFNAVLAERVQTGTWNVPVAGDLLRKEESGGIFLCTDVQLDRERAERGEVCPTGPLVGDRMRQPEGEVLDLEQRIATPFIEGIDLRRARSLGEGTRRPLRLHVAELSHSVLEAPHESAGTGMGSTPNACAIQVRFVLPKGAYATTVLANAFTIVDAGRQSGTGEREERQLATDEEE